MLQRFRQGRDFKQPDKQAPASKKAKKVQILDKENNAKWWLNGQTGAGKDPAKASVEKARYIKALKVIVQDKGIPSLCICGGSVNGPSSAAANGKKKKSENQMCASNCQFYKNEKDYERVLRDIIACAQ